MDGAQVAVMRVLCEEHTRALSHYALRLTGERARAEHVVQKTLIRALRHPELADDNDGSARALRFTVARHMIFGEGRAR
jgi:RNA polymerase sigma-70 factor, ECF subfamily